MLIWVISASGQTTYTWIGASGDSWAVSTNWSPTRTTPATTDIIQFNDGGTYSVTAIPAQTIRQLLITGSSNITLQSSGTTTLTINGLTLTNNLVVESGSTLQIGPTNTLTITMTTTASQRADISGTLNVNSGTFTTSAVATSIFTASSTGMINNNGGTITSSAATLVFSSGSTYNHARNGGVVPTATWNASSICNITGITTTNPTGFSGTFGNVTWNCAGQTTATGAISGAMTVAGSLTNTTGTMNFSGFVVSVKGDVVNDGTINTTIASSSLTMNGTALQNIGGSGTWTTGTTGRLLNLVVNNSSGANLNIDIAVQTALTLTAGVLGGTGTLTIGVPATAVTTTRTAGSLANVPTFEYTTGAYAITYNGGAAINTGYELPPSSTPTNGVLTVSIANTNVTLMADANIGRITTSVATTTTFNLNGYTLGLSDATSVANTGVINASAATSTLLFNGTVAQNFALAGTYTGSIISNIIVDNTNAATGLSLGTANINVGNLTVNASRILTLAGYNINIKNNLTNNGTINSTAANSTITMNGTLAQNINGSGSETWTTGIAGSLLNLNINNTAGVTINASFAVRTLLTLTAGVLTSSTLTIGVPATNVTVTRLAGSLANVPSFNYTTGAYAINYNSAATNYTVLNELPSSGTPTNGVLTVSTATTTVTLDKDANIGTLTTSIAGATFNLNGYTLGLSLLTSISNTGTITANGATSTLLFNGTVAQNFALAGTYTGSIISNIIVDNTNAATGLSLGTANINVGNLTVNALRILTLGAYNINIKNNIQNDGLIYSNNAASSITINGTSAQSISGAGNYTSVAPPTANGRLMYLIINNAAGVSLNQNVTVQTALTLTAGVLGGTGTLTIGIPATVVTTTRTTGSLANVPTFGYTTGAYAITYNGGAAINTGYELPPSSTPTNGILTVQIANTNVTLTTDANIGTLTTSVATTTTFSLNGYTLGLSLTTPVSNTGVINASAGTSTLLFNGTVVQTFTLAGTYTGSLISNMIVDNTNAATGVTLGTTNINVGNLTINSGRILTLGAFNINIKNNLQNDGLIYSNNAASSITMNGTSAQSVAGAGNYTSAAPPTTNGRLMYLIINNAAGVSLNQNVTIQTQLTLTAGILGGSGTLTIGIPATAVTTARTAGSLANIPVFGYTTGAYAITYNGASQAYSVLNELPVATTPTNGVLSVNGTTCTVALDKNANIGSLTTTAGNIFNVNGYTLGLSATGAVMSNAGTFNATTANSGVTLNGTAAQTLTIAGTYTSNTIPNLTLNNAAGTALATNTTVSGVLTVSVGAFTVNSGITLTVSGMIAGAGTLTSGTSAAILVLGGSSSSMGIINLTSGAQTFSSLTFNNSSTTNTISSPTVTIAGNLTLSAAASALVMNGNASGGGVLAINGNLIFSTAATTFTLTSGIVKMGNSTVTYTNNVAAASNLRNSLNTGNEKSYYAFLGSTGGFVLSETIAALSSGLTLNFPVGPAGDIDGYRPFTIVTNAITNIVINETVKIGFINHSGGTSYSPTNVPTVDGSSNANVRAGYIFNVTLSGTIGTTGPNITMAYQNADFNTVPSGAANVKIWQHSGYWTNQSQTSNGTSGSNITITKNAFPLTAAGTYPLNLGETNNDPVVTNTWTWIGVTSANWATASNWSPASIPNASNASVIINNPVASYQPNINTASETVYDITIGNSCTLTIGAYTLTIYGTFSNSGTVNATAAASTVAYVGTSQVIAPINYYNLTANTATTPVLSSTGTIGIANTFTPGAAVYTYTGSIIIFNGTVAQNIPAFNYFNNVNFNSTVSNSLTGAISVYGNMNVNTPVFNDGGYVITGGSGNLSIAATSTYNVGSTTVGTTVPTFTSYTFTTGSTVSFMSNLAQIIPGLSSAYSNIKLAAPVAITKTAGNDFTVGGTLTINAGNTLADAGYTITVNGNVVNNGTHSGTGKIFLSGGSGVHAISGGTSTFGNLELDDASGASITGTGATTLAGNLTITNGTFTVNAFTTSLAQSNTYTTSISEILLIANNATAKTFGNVIVNNGSSWNNSSNAPVTISGNLQNDGTFTSGTGTYTLSGTNKIISGSNAFSFTTVTISGSGYLNSNNNLSVSGTFTVSLSNGLINAGTITAGTLSVVNATNGVINAGTVKINTALSGAGAFVNGYAGGTINGIPVSATDGTSAGLLYYSPTAVIAITTLTATGAGGTLNNVIYNGSSTQSVKSTTYYHLTIGTTSPLTTPTATAAGNITVNGDLTIASGSFSDGASTYTMTGNASGSFSVNANAAYTTLHTASPYMPSVYTSITLDPTSTFNYNGAGAHTIVSTPNGTVTLTSYGILGIGGSAVKTLATAVSAQSITVATSSTLADGAFQVSGPGTGSGTFTLNSASVYTMTNTNISVTSGYNGPMPLFANFSFNSGSTVNYNAVASQNIYCIPSPGYGNLALGAGSATTKTLVTGGTSTYVQGTVTTSNVNNTLDLNGQSLYIAGATPLSNTGTLTSNVSGSVINCNGTISQTLTIAGTYTNPLNVNLTITNTNVAGVLLGGSYSFMNVTINNSSLLNLNAKILSIAGTYSNSGTLTGDAASSGITLNGISGQNFSVGTYTGSALYNFTINNSAGVTLSAPLNVNGVFTLTSGILNTDATNILIVTATGTGAVAGGSTLSYIKGPMARALPASLASGSTYIFPIGKSVYNLFELVNPTTGVSGTVTAEVFDASSGGTAGFGLSALNTNRYWQASTSSGFIISTTVRLTEPSLGGANRVGQSTTLNGTYVSRGGTAPSPILSDPVSPALNYFVLGTGVAITLNGTYTVGGSGQFLKLTNVANILNSATVTGNVVFELLQDYDGTVGETFPIIFNQYAMSKATWTATIRPAASVSTMLLTSGTTGSLGLITLSGIDLITFDGRPGGTGSMTDIKWTIQNTAAGSSYPTFLFINGASNNILQYLQVKSSCTNTTGTIEIGTSTVAGGNSNNAIQYCNIGNYAAQPYNGILSDGTAGANANASNSILNNNIYNFRSFTSYSSSPLNGGISVTPTGNGSNWNINNNSLYANVVTTGSTLAPIYFEPGASSTGNTISGNYIGGQAPQCGGNYWLFNGAGATWNGWSFEGINVKSGGTTVSGNTIQNIKMNWTGVGSVSQHIVGIYVVDNGGPATITDNLIGSQTQCNSIYGANAGQVFGILNMGSSPVTISNNTVANMTSNFDFPSEGFTQSGIGGIICNMPGGVASPNSVTNNVVFNLSNEDNYNGSYVISGWNFGTGGGSWYGPMGDINCKGGSTNSQFGGQNIMIVGIYIQQWNATNVTHSVSNNTVFGLNSLVTGGTWTSYIIGIFDNCYGSNFVMNINANRVYGLFAPDNYGSSGTYFAGLIGIFVPPNQTGTHNITNNMVQLGYKTDGTTVKNSSITGIWDNSDWNNVNLKIRFHFNSVYIGGTDNTCMNSYAFRRSLLYSSAVYDSLNLRNNIFVNNRSNASANHYGIFLNDKIDVTSNKNIIYGNGSGFVFGNYLGTDYANLAAWQTATSLDPNSIQSDPLFVNQAIITPDFHIQSGSPAIGVGGRQSTTTDYDGESRSNPPDIGADEYSSGYTPVNLGLTGCEGETPLPVELLSFTAIADNDHVDLKWSTVSETNNDYFTIERSKTSTDFEKLFDIDGAGNSNSLLTYNTIDEEPLPGLSYYRLKQTDFDGAFSYSEIRPVFFGDDSGDGIFNTWVDDNKNLNILFMSEGEVDITVSVFDTEGRLISEVNKKCDKGLNTLKLDATKLAGGIYLLKINHPNSIFSDKFFVTP
ncbi:MAG: T9SS type A sorting domain-containing protein [Bacteroidota bacterium]